MSAARITGILALALTAGCCALAGPSQPVTTGEEAVGIEPVAGAPATPSSRPSAAKAAPSVKAPAKASTSPKKPEPPLDVDALKTRLRNTDAIGVFTKLALKNQVDDLMQQFREHYQSGDKTGVASLRQPYDMLVLKVLALVQDGDPSLARTIAGSREAIWGILADREKFNAAT